MPVAEFPRAPRKAGMYESFYLRAVAPTAPVGVWIRYTVHKRKGAAPKGSLWCTVFDAERGRPWMSKRTSDELSAPANGWIAIGDAKLSDGHAEGECGGATWSLQWQTEEPELRHLQAKWMYRSRLPRTKLTSPAPDARFDGEIALPDGRRLELDGWRGMVGHNWGAEHAERWIWLHGIGFEDAPDAWLDVALGRIKVAGRLTPWIANGALRLGDEHDYYRVGGIGRRGLYVAEHADGCRLKLPAANGLTIDANVTVPAGSAAGWRYADPDGGEHEVMNCSVARLELTLGPSSARRSMRTEHGGVYELGMRPGEPHGVPIAPFADG